MRPYLALASVILFGLATASTALQADTLTIFKSANCGCCSKWADRMKAAGFDVATKDVPMSVLQEKKTEGGIKPEYASCHTGKIDGYTIEGHVPASDVARLLKERPADAVGLSVPGMPIGSPGMEVGDHKEAYQVLLIKKDGSTSVWARH